MLVDTGLVEPSGSAPPASPTAAARRWRSRRCAIASWTSTTATPTSRGSRPAERPSRSPAQPRSSRGATSSTPWCRTAARSTRRPRRRRTTWSPGASRSSPTSRASSSRAGRPVLRAARRRSRRRPRRLVRDDQRGRALRGQPTARNIKTQISKFHSSYYLDSSRQPAPTLIQRLERRPVPRRGGAALLQRLGALPRRPDAVLPTSATPAAEQARDLARSRRGRAWFDQHVKGGGTDPAGRRGADLHLPERRRRVRRPLRAATGAASRRVRSAPDGRPRRRSPAVPADPDHRRRVRPDRRHRRLRHARRPPTRRRSPIPLDRRAEPAASR